MHGQELLVQLVVVLGTAAVTTVVFQAARLPVALGYVLAGLVIGPHVPVPLVADPDLVGVLSELGVILLLFSIGLELRLGALSRVGAAAGLTAVIEVAVMVTIGWLVARALGFGASEALFVGAAVGISSTMLVARAFEDARAPAALAELVFAILVFEDLLAILLLAILTGVASGAGLSAAELAGAIGRLLGFLAATLCGGLLVVPRALRLVARLGRPETLLVTGLAVCFGLAALAAAAGYSVALGAFVAGTLVAESGKGHAVGEQVRPFRDVFAAIFFVSIGMTIAPDQLAAAWPAIAVLTLVVLVGKTAAVSAGAFLAGNGLAPAIRAGLSMAQIGELSFVMAGIGVAGGVARPSLLPVVVGVGCLTAIATPVLVGRSAAIATRIARRLPRRVATFVSLYDGWLARLRARPADAGTAPGVRRAIAVLLVDAAALVAVAIGWAVSAPAVLAWLADTMGAPAAVARAGWIGAGLAVATVFAVGVVRTGRRLAGALAEQVAPRTIGAPRRALTGAFEVAIALAVGAPVAALTQPFVPGGAALVLAALVALALGARRAMRELDGHVRAGSELVMHVLGKQSAPEAPEDMWAPLGLGLVTTVELVATAPAVGRSLAELDLRARTGATVLAIRRGGGEVVAPSPRDPLRAGDALALAGSDAEVAAAREVLSG